MNGGVSHHRVSTYDGGNELVRTDDWNDGTSTSTRSERWAYGEHGVTDHVVVDGRQGWSTGEHFTYEDSLIVRVDRAEGTTLDSMLPRQTSRFSYDGGVRLLEVSVTALDGTPESKTTYAYFDSGKLSSTRWATEGLLLRTLNEDYDPEGHIIHRTSTANGAGTVTANIFGAGKLLASEATHEDATSHGTQSTRNYYDNSLRLFVSVSSIADVDGEGQAVTGYTGTRYIRSNDGAIARVEMDQNGDCAPDGFVLYTRGSAEGEVVEQRLGSAVTPDAAKRTFSAECALDLSTPPPTPYAI